MKEMSLTTPVALQNGTTIPLVGYGTWQTPDGDVARESVKQAIIAGYRHIDTAAVYRNEVSVGEGIREGLAATGLKREDLYVTTKIWCDKKGPHAKEAILESLKRLGLDYVDLLLIHWPIATAEKANDAWKKNNNETWKAMEELVREGKLRSIGLSNFRAHHIEALECEIPPVIDQLEIHPGYIQKETVDYCKEHGIVVEAWSPLGSGRVLADPFLNELAAKYGKSVAQLCIRFCLQYGVVPLPKSVHADRIVANTEVFDFEISEEDFSAILAMEQLGFSGNDPDGKLNF